MKGKSKNLFIIFGTTRGIGKALYEYASDFSGNDFILVNRSPIEITKKCSCQKLVLDLSKAITQDCVLKLHKIFSGQDGFENIYLILNASVIEPIVRIGRADDKLLLKSGHANFLNYERIINIFISSTRSLNARKKILAISSGTADSPNIGISSYCSTKAALEMLIRCLFLEQRDAKEYSVIALRPGVVDTDMQKKMRASKKENFPKAGVHKKIFEQKKLLAPKQVAHKIYFLLNSDKYWSNPIIDISEIP
jgi:NAD(P)-dependent dehydrogenase (short-subunit alcohol dehydrogenase family)